MNRNEAIHLRPPVGQMTRRDYAEGRAYCGRRGCKLTSDRSFATCIDCQAAHDADHNEAIANYAAAHGLTDPETNR